MATGITSTYPQRFGRYILTSKIAMGGMAEIFRAKSVGAEGFEKVVVIKRILPHFCEDEGFVTMFKDEARVAAHLSHANVVQIFDFDEVDELFYIAMEYVEGRDLKRVLDVGAKLGKPLSIAQSVAIMIEASKGLDYAHKRVVDGQPLNIIHRDVSPHNVMVSFNGEVKIMDFGIAKAASRSTKTRVGTVKGKCAYMSPEQARGKNLDPRSDLFALGVCLWEMLTGKRLFVGDSDFETLNNVLRAEVPAPSELNPEVPKELDAIVLRSLAREVDDRQKDVGGFVNELNRWYFSAVPDPDAINLKGYMHDLFEAEIEALRQEVAGEAAMMEQARKAGISNVAVRRPATGSQPAAGAQDERTMALPDAAMPADSDRTMALPDAMAQLRGKSAVGIAAAPPAPAKKSNTGVLVGVGVLAAVGIGIGAFVMSGGKPAEPPAQNKVAAPAEPVKVKVTIKAPGATEYQLDGTIQCDTKDECAVDATLGKHKVIVKNAEGKVTVQDIEVNREGQIVDVKLPVAEKKPEAAAQVAGAQALGIFIKIAPDSATLTVNGKPVALTGGTGKIPEAKPGEPLKIEAKADGYKPETFEKMATKDGETFELKLEKAGGSAAPSAGRSDSGTASAGPGKLVLAPKPWAKVSIKGKDYGMAPPLKIDLPAGTYKVQLTKGTVQKSVSVTVKTGQTSTLNVDMTEE